MVRAAFPTVPEEVPSRTAAARLRLELLSPEPRHQFLCVRRAERRRLASFIRVISSGRGLRDEDLYGFHRFSFVDAK